MHASQFPYRAALMALALLWQAPSFAAEETPTVETDLPDAVHGPSADRVPPGLACTDDMDFSPEDNMPSPFDADLVAFHIVRDQPAPPPATTDEGCDGRIKLNLT
jgi:hypothetical protein